MSLSKRLAICALGMALPLAAVSQADARHGHHGGHHRGHHHAHYGASYTTVPVVRRTVYRVVRPSCCGPAHLVPLSSHIIHGGAATGGIYSSGYAGTAWGAGPSWGAGPRVGLGVGGSPGLGGAMGSNFGYGPSIGLRGGLGMW